MKRTGHRRDGLTLFADPHGKTLIKQFLIDRLVLHPDISDGAAVLVDVDALHQDPALITGEDFFQVGLGL